MVRTAHQRTRFDPVETKLEAGFADRIEFLGSVIAHHRQMLPTGGQILPDCEDITANLAQALHGFNQLGPTLPDSHHDP